MIHEIHPEGKMEVLNWKECEEKKIDKFPYKGKMLEVKGTSVRWLSKYGDDGHGYPEYGLRLFTIQPDGQIPTHNHFYHQTMYVHLFPTLRRHLRQHALP